MSPFQITPLYENSINYHTIKQKYMICKIILQFGVSLYSLFLFINVLYSSDTYSEEASLKLCILSIEDYCSHIFLKKLLVICTLN